jgi:hypothetical protein
MANKRLTTKSTPNQPKAMEAKFGHLEVLVMIMASNMASQVKPTTLALGDSSTQVFNLRFFMGLNFQGH